MPQLEHHDIAGAKRIVRDNKVSAEDLSFLILQFIPRFLRDLEYAKSFPEREILDLIPDFLSVKVKNDHFNQDLGEFGSRDYLWIALRNYQKDFKFFAEGIWNKKAYKGQWYDSYKEFKKCFDL